VITLGRNGRSQSPEHAQGKILFVGAVEVEDGGLGPGRIRLTKSAEAIMAKLERCPVLSV
jgi:hypothetical protein